jgi:hypothetical protein
MEMTKPTKLVIDRKRWLYGGTKYIPKPYNTDHIMGISEISGLLRNTEAGDKMCCLGFLCLAFGKTESEIRNQPMPSSDGVGKLPTNLLWLFEPTVYNGKTNTWDGKTIKLWQLKLSNERPPATPKRYQFDKVSYTGW